MCLLISPALADISYTVKSGDTLSELAQRFAVPLQDLIERNKIADPDKIAVGQVLTLPDSAAEAVKAAEEKAKATAEEKAAAPTPRTTDPRKLAEERARLLAQQRGEQLVANAQQHLGVPYRWAGSTSRGLDCSGLVVRSMALLGKDVPHNSAALYKMGVPVKYKDLQPGDLVFFNTNGKGISHVGIWIGNHTFIHASTKQGVVQQRMEGYYAKRLVGARRIQ